MKDHVYIDVHYYLSGSKTKAFTWFKFYSLMNIITSESELFIELHVAKTFLW